MLILWAMRGPDAMQWDATFPPTRSLLLPLLGTSKPGYHNASIFLAKLWKKFFAQSPFWKIGSIVVRFPSNWFWPWETGLYQWISIGKSRFHVFILYEYYNPYENCHGSQPCHFPEKRACSLFNWDLWAYASHKNALTQCGSRETYKAQGVTSKVGKF